MGLYLGVDVTLMQIYSLICFIGLMESDPSEQGSFSPKEEEIGSHVPAPS